MDEAAAMRIWVTVRTVSIVVACLKGRDTMANYTTPAEFSELDDRYTKLVEKKYRDQLSESEQAEMASLALQLSERDASFYEPILERLRKLDPAN